MNNSSKDNSMRKGDLVRLNPTACFTTEQGGGLRYPLSNTANDEAGTVGAFYKLTDQQKADWRNSDAAKGMTDAGETKLCPSEGGVALHRDNIYPVLRARAQATYNYRNRGGLVKLLDTTNGREVFVDRRLVELAV